MQTGAVILGTAGISLAAAMLWVRRRTPTLSATAPKKTQSGLLLGCRPGPGLERRVRGAATLWSAGLLDQLVLSGYQEASIARDYALTLGIPSDAMQLEPDARTTYENLLFARPLIGDDPFWLISDAWHLPRAQWIADDLGMLADPYPVKHQQGPAGVFRTLAREGVSVLHRHVTKRGGLLQRTHTAD